MKRVLLILPILLFANLSLANNDMNLAAFAKTEQNDLNDKIHSVGFEVLGKINQTPFAVGFSSALGHAKVTTNSYHTEDFITLDTGLKFGFFSNVYAYAEVGLDMFELMFHDKRERDKDDNFNFYKYNEDNNDIDVYAGAAIGVDFAPFRLEAYTRYRQIDGNGWDIKDNQFYGVQFSVYF